jgi:two-component system sensor histidine kinase DesK
VRWLAVVVAVLAVEAWVLHMPPSTWVPGIIFAPLIGAANIFFAESARNRRKLRLAQDEVERLAKMAERERIARDLHDLLGHTLSVIALKSELAGRLVDRDVAAAAAEIRDVERISRQALAEVRRAVQGYRQHGLQAELAGVRLALEAAGIAVAHEGAVPRLPPAVEGVLAFALREAVTNVVRHAGAHHCRIALEGGPGEVALEVADDGRGGLAAEGLGLTGMRERATALGGRVERRGDGGTTLRVTLPLDAGEPAASAVATRTAGAPVPLPEPVT